LSFCPHDSYWESHFVRNFSFSIVEHQRWGMTTRGHDWWGWRTSLALSCARDIWVNYCSEQYLSTRGMNTNLEHVELRSADRTAFLFSILLSSSSKKRLLMRADTGEKCDEVGVICWWWLWWVLWWRLWKSWSPFTPTAGNSGRAVVWVLVEGGGCVDNFHSRGCPAERKFC
jgi:hypothetical protein